MSDHEDTPLGSALREAARDHKHGFKIDFIRENFDDIAQVAGAKCEGKRLRIRAVVEIINKEFGLDLDEDTFRSYVSRVKKERKGRPGNEHRTGATPPVGRAPTPIASSASNNPGSVIEVPQTSKEIGQLEGIPPGVSPATWAARQAAQRQRKGKFDSSNNDQPKKGPT